MFLNIRQSTIVLFLLISFSFIESASLWAQGKKTLSGEVYDDWNWIRNRQISNDGNWIIYSRTPQEGDATLLIKDLRKRDDIKSEAIARGESAQINAESKFVVFKIKAHLDSIKALRRIKTPKSKLPKDSLGIYALLGDSLIKIPEVKSFKMPEKAGNYLAYHLYPQPFKKKKAPKLDSLSQDSTQLESPEKPGELNKEEGKKNKDKKKNKTNPEEVVELELVEEVAVEKSELEIAQEKIQALQAELAKIEAEKARKEALAKQKVPKPKVENEENGSKLILHNLLNARQDTFLFVKDYIFDEKARKLAFVSTGNDSSFQAGVYIYDLEAQQLKLILNKPGKHKRLQFDEAGTQIAFVSDTDTTKANKKAQIRNWELYYWQEKQNEATKLAAQGSSGIPQGWLISEHARLDFSKDGSKLYFGTAPKPLVKDTTLLPEEIVRVDVWNWQDGRLQSEQKVQLKSDQERSYRAVVYPRYRRITQLASPEVPQIITGQEGNADFAIGISNVPYQKYLSWEGYPAYVDVFLINYRDGRKTKLKEKLRAQVRLSPDAQYLYWYAVQDTAWYTHSFRTGQTYNLTGDLNQRFYNEFHDYPDYPRAYGSATWVENDAYLLIYDRFDIWRFQAEKREAPLRITQNGRENRISYRYIQLDREKEYLAANEDLMLYAFDEENKSSGYFQTNLSGAQVPRKLIFDDYRFSYPVKAKAKNRYIFTRESFQDFPDVYFSDAAFTKINRLSNANPQQANYYWGSVELVKWTNMDGEEMQGLLYKPENFDPGKKYPMITYFYERVSNRLHNYVAPTPSPSTIRASMYTSNGYLVFMPDIPYKVGYPGRSAYNAVVSGVTQLLKEPYIDRDKLGLQGQSWGGYQVAYIITQSNLFSAAMAGAPVSNMTSAYGGIRWGSGRSRMFQYEHSQSRIGKTLWEDPLLYMENSPLFYADKIETPLLMMHNDADGAVPWYQGIEFFVGLRRLQKPVWMLSYNDEAHNLRLRQNRKDLAKRMRQFFDYYLKFSPMPRWMGEGVPAIEKGIEKGYELMDAEKE